jgi:hypothetical protein
MNHPATSQRPAGGSTRRAFLGTGARAAALLALFPSLPGSASSTCYLPYGKGAYGRGCYPGQTPGLLRLPPSPGNVQQDGFHFFLHGEPNRAYQVQYSADLTNWTSLGILIMPASGEPLEIRDEQAGTAPRRFYRGNPL